MPPATPVSFSDAERREEASASLRHNGYATMDVVPGSSSALAPLLAEAIVLLGQRGWRPCYVIVFDEAWRLFEELAEALAQVVGGEPLVPIWDFYAWHVRGGGGGRAQQATPAGWPPHRDRDIAPGSDDDGKHGWDDEGRPRFLTVWFALTGNETAQGVFTRGLVALGSCSLFWRAPFGRRTLLRTTTASRNWLASCSLLRPSPRARRRPNHAPQRSHPTRHDGASFDHRPPQNVWQRPPRATAACTCCPAGQTLGTLRRADPKPRRRRWRRSRSCSTCEPSPCPPAG